MSEAIEVTYRLGPEDYRHYARYHFDRHLAFHPATRTLHRLARPLAIVALLLASLLLLLACVQRDTFALTISILAFPISLLVLFFPRLVAWNTARRIMRSANARVLGEQRMRFAAEGLECATPVSRTQLSWSGIERIEEDTQHLYFYIATDRAFIVPRGAFGDAPAVREALAQVEEWRAAPRDAEPGR